MDYIFVAAALVIAQLALTMASVALGAAAAAAIVVAAFVVVVVVLAAAAAAAQVCYYFPPANSVTFEFLFLAAVAYAVTVVAEFQTCLV